MGLIKTLGLKAINPLLAVGSATKEGMDSAYNDHPSVQTVDTPGMDAQTQEGVDAQRAHAERGLSDFAADTTNGVTQGTMLQNGGGLSLGGNDGMSDALNNRAQKSYDREINNISNQANLSSYGKKMDALGHAGTLAGHQVSASNQRADFAHAQIGRKMAEQANREASRNQVLSSVLGFGGMVAGSVAGTLAGGPVGTAAGGMTGKQIAEGLGGDVGAPQMMGGEPTGGKYFA